MPDKATVKRLIEEELERNASDAGWKGKGVSVGLTTFSLTADLRAQVQAIGDVHGCHTCKTRLEIDRDQPWVGDHIPPTELSVANKKSIRPEWDSGTYLFPQCHECSYAQSAVVRSLNGGKNYADLDAKEKRLIGSGKRFNLNKCVPSSGPKVTPTEGQQIQVLGSKNGCHSCHGKVPTTVYHADHTFPQEFCTNYMQDVFKDLGLTYPTTFELRPQCPRCSGNQGGKVKQIMEVATAYARENLKITVYKF
jgi:hypothetical protein